jgi:sulfite exporter TauE/SafE
MSNNTIAFFIGLFGSVHCIGMCGPLAFAVPTIGNKWWLIVTDRTLYNLGRVITYTLLGLLIGLVGKQLWIYNLQQGISLLSGLLIIMAAITRLFKIRLTGSKVLSHIFSPVNKLLAYAIQHHDGHFVVGLINGLLPCGFVYLALAGAVNTISPMTAAQYMFWFGLGTFPLMLIATVSSGFISPLLRRRINRTIPYLMVCLGFWFILRGLNLDIPYLSPAKQTTGVSTCH